MGRSINSRNRILEVEGNSVKTKAFDEDKLEDPSLIIYYPIKNFLDYHIVSNGDQTDTIYEFIKNDNSFENALSTRKFEPDWPICTPRIPGFIDSRKEKTYYGMSILKSINNDPDFCQRSYFYYSDFVNGFGHCIHTYKEDGNPAPSFDKEPFIVKLYNNIEDSVEHYWNLLNEENKISLLVKYVSTVDRKINLKIINKNKII
jgi:hypothetical protein